VTPQKGIENLRVAISSDGTLGDFQVKEMVIHPEESTKSSTTTGIKGLGILSVNAYWVIRLLSFSFSPLSLLYSLVPCLVVFSPTFFLPLHFSQLFTKVSSKVLHFIENVIFLQTARKIS